MSKVMTTKITIFVGTSNILLKLAESFQPQIKKIDNADSVFAITAESKYLTAESKH